MSVSMIVSVELFIIMFLSLPSGGGYVCSGKQMKLQVTVQHEENEPRGLRLGGYLMLILHLKWSDNSARKMRNDIEFPLVNLSLRSYYAKCK